MFLIKDMKSFQYDIKILDSKTINDCLFVYTKAGCY